MATIIPLSPKASLFIASWLESGMQNESDAPDECADPAVDIANTLNPFGTADAECAVIICSPEDAQKIHMLASDTLPDDTIDILATACARAYQVMGATNAYDGVRNTTRSERFHGVANTLIDAMQLELGRLAGLCDGNGFQNSSIAEALYNGSADPGQCLAAAEIAKELRERNASSPLGSTGLPMGYRLTCDADGEWILTPPDGVTIYSEPNEGWIVTAEAMKGRDWDSRSDVIAACLEYIAGQEPGQ